MDFALKSINRSTYSILDYLGDIGGFRDIIQIILGFVLSGYTAYNLDSHILYQLFDQKMKKKPAKKAASDANADIKASFDSYRPFDLRSGFISWLCLRKGRKRILEKSTGAMES